VDAHLPKDETVAEGRHAMRENIGWKLLLILIVASPNLLLLAAVALLVLPKTRKQITPAA
jgi:hypothetical protein